MSLPAILRRLFCQRTLLALLVNAACSAATAAETTCIDPVEYRRFSQRYADLFPKFDLTSVAQEYVDVSVDLEDLKNSVTECRKNSPETGQQQCDPVTQQYNTKAAQLKDVERRFYAALNMQEYLLTLKLKLEQPQCEK